MVLGDALRGASCPHLCPGPGAVTGDGDLGLQQLRSPDVPRVPMVMSQLHLGPLGSIRIRKGPPPISEGQTAGVAPVESWSRTVQVIASLHQLMEDICYDKS